MPYIKPELRTELDNDIDQIIKLIKLYPIDDRDGNVNYTLTRIIMGALEPDEGWKYKNMQRVMGLLACMQQEIYRRKIAPYEDKVAKFNGDVGELHPTNHRE